jgi:hypothetical protein
VALKWCVDDVPETWVREQFGDLMVQHIINMRQEDGWSQAHRDVAVFIGKLKIARVKFMRERVRYVTDVKKLRLTMVALKFQRNKAVANLNENRQNSQKKLSVKAKEKAQKERLMLVEKIKADIVKLMDNPPKKKTKVQASWLGKTVKGETVPLDEEFVRTAFGDMFTNEVMGLKRGFVDIPVGDYKPSRLADYPNLFSSDAYPMKFMQQEGKDLCVSKSLASALYAMGWHEVAIEVDAYGEEILNGAVVEAIERVGKFTRKLLPNWVTMRLLPKNFDHTHHLNENDLVLGALMASDGSCSHAITIHGSGLVFDANESIALPLCKESLDYCTSTATVLSEFVRFKRGWWFRYEGKKPSRLEKMMINTEEDGVELEDDFFG